MFPLISSSRYWTYGTGDNINNTSTPIRYNELFPALRVSAVLNMIENDFGVNFDGSFLTNNKFLNAYLWLKNSEDFVPVLSYEVFKYQDYENVFNPGANAKYQWQNIDLVNYRFTSSSESTNVWAHKVEFLYRATGTGVFDVELWNVTDNVSEKKISGNVASATTITLNLLDYYLSYLPNKTFEVRISVVSGTIIFTSGFSYIRLDTFLSVGGLNYPQLLKTTAAQTINQSDLKINKQFPEIKIEDFFSGLLKMFNLTCFSNDGINYTLERIDDYYNNGSFIDITKYIDIESNTSVNRVKTFKKINFDYEKSESIINVGFLGSTGLEYGSLSADTGYEGEEYNIKLPFEDLNFNNIVGGLLQVGYALKSDLAKYVPKAVILYDYNPSGLTTCPQFYFNTNLTGGTSTAHTTYKAFGQETLISSETFSLNFGTQQSTLTNLIIENGLYAQNYDQYLSNIFNIKSRLIKIKTYLPTSILTTIKLNDRLIIRDKRYIINSMNLDLTTGEVQFELLNDFRTI
jgi:hypothetical protein